MQSVFSAVRRGGSVRARQSNEDEANPALDERRLEEAVSGLRTRSPELSAGAPVWRWQRRALAVALALLCIGVVLAPETTLIALLAILAFPFLCVVVLRSLALWHLWSGRRQAAPKPLRRPIKLPHYTILVPMFREAAVVSQLVDALRAMDYPRDRLEILLIVESIDHETREALRGISLDDCMRVLVVPDGMPRTKPRAVQFALQYARGDLVVIYDAEDVPERDQLLRAAAVMHAGGARLGCVQASLNIYNTDASWLTRQFTIEYTALFDAILPTLERLRFPVPLGGTSNHFRRSALESVGGWDPYNVTEDADLGIRLARQGWHVGALASTTWEEAPPSFRVWLGQRTRWLKGWMQTYLVHTRQPYRLWKELGFRRFVGLQVLMGGLILSALVHPWFYLFVGYDLWQGQVLSVPETAFGRWLLGIGIFNLIVGYLSAMALGTVAAARRGRAGLALQSIFMPIYWLAISFAAYRALWQLVWKPYFWEKTQHGLSGAVPDELYAAQGASSVKNLSASAGIFWRASK